MNESEARQLSQRVDQLEAAIADLRQWLQRLEADLAIMRGDRASPPVTAATAIPKLDLEDDENVLGEELPLPEPVQRPVTAARQETQAMPPARATPVSAAPQGNWLNNSEFWLNRVGIGLLLLGVAFLFKYSIDQGWMTPLVRVGFGLALGVSLLVIGQRIRDRRRPLSQVLQGGGIATFYITGFAAFQLFQLFPYPVAFLFMVVVTLLAFFLSLRQQTAVLSVLGAVGGLATPFLLYQGEGSLAGLVVYVCLLLAGTSAIYFQQGWRSLLWTSFVGVWLVYLVGYGSSFDNATPPMGDRLVLQLGVGLAMLAFWPLPLVRILRQRQAPQRWPESEAKGGWRSAALLGPAYPLSLLTPPIGFQFVWGIWELQRSAAAGLAIAFTLVCALAGGYLRQRRLLELANSQVLTAFLLGMAGLLLLLEGPVVLPVLAAEAALMQWSARKLSAQNLKIAGHLLAGAVGYWLLIRLFTHEAVGTSGLNLPALADLGVIAIALGMSWLLRDRPAVLIYQGLAHVGLLVWFWRELGELPNGNAYISIAWGVYAVVLLVLGLRRDLQGARWAGLATLGLVVLKLFVMDLALLDPFWRILLFLGFGGIFLVLSYLLRSLWTPR